VWIQGENFEVDMENVVETLQEQELKLVLSNEGKDISLPGSDSPVCSLVKMLLLHLAVFFNRVGNVRTLLAAGAEAGHYYRGHAPLFSAAMLGHTRLVRILHEYNASLSHPAVTNRCNPPPSTNPCMPPRSKHQHRTCRITLHFA
jgi:hypothetical protein